MRKAVTWGRNAPARKVKQAKTVSGRNLLHEQTLCLAIKERKSVELRYEIEVLHRTYEPYAVYHATTDNVLVTGLQTKNPLKPFERPETHNFTVGKIADVRIIDLPIARDAKIDRSDARFKNGIICCI